MVSASIAGGCVSTGAKPRPFPMPGPRPLATTPAVPEASPTPPASSDPSTTATARAVPPLANEVTGTALTLRGAPYRNGGIDPRGFDCSGFTQYVFGQHGIPLPREVRDQFVIGTPVRADAIGPGDLLFFATVAPGPSHVGIALGGGAFVHAPSSTGVVRVERISTAYWAERFVAAHRVSR